MDSSSTRTVVVGITANSLIALAKFAGWALSGSSAMLSEAIHSVADTANQALLLLGLRRSGRGADERHPYGYGRARFFWGLVSALGIFFLGSGVTLYHGFHSLFRPEPARPGWVDWTVLGVAFCFESVAAAVALRGLREDAARVQSSLWRYLVDGRDPTSMAVLLEDGAALAGLLLAAAGIGLTQWTGWHGWDALASILIGVLLALIAIILIAQNKSYLLTRGLDAPVKRRVREAIEAHGTVERVGRVAGVVNALDRWRVTVEVDFDGRRIAERLLADRDLDALSAELSVPAQARAFLCDFAEEVVSEIAREVAQVEQRIQQAVPEVKDVDIEAG